MTDEQVGTWLFGATAYGVAGEEHVGSACAQDSVTVGVHLVQVVLLVDAGELDFIVADGRLGRGGHARGIPVVVSFEERFGLLAV
jgi:hypothetical protein